MRCVSKFWNALLSQSSFVKSHLELSIRKNDTILLFLWLLGGGFSVIRPSRSPDLELTNFIKLPVNLVYDGASVGGSVNGLVCLYNFDGSQNHVVQIWNPSLSAVLTLPPYSMPTDGHDRIDVIFRLGFDPKSDDYKVVKLASYLRTPTFMGPLYRNTLIVRKWLRVEVYIMKKGFWQLITQRFPSHITEILEENKVCVDGHDGLLHWLGFIDEKKKLQMIVAFDLGVETFREILLPDLVNNAFIRFNVLGVLAEKLCVMSSDRDSECEVWVMDEYGVDGSWVKHHVFSQFSGYISPYGFTLHNGFIFQCWELDLLYFFDPIAAKVKSFKSIDFCLEKVVLYVDSLVWVAPLKRDINSCSSSIS